MIARAVDLVYGGAVFGYAGGVEGIGKEKGVKRRKRMLAGGRGEKDADGRNGEVVFCLKRMGSGEGDFG